MDRKYLRRFFAEQRRTIVVLEQIVAKFQERRVSMKKQPYDLKSYRAGFRDGLAEKSARYADVANLVKACRNLLDFLEHQVGGGDLVLVLIMDKARQALEAVREGQDV